MNIQIFGTKKCNDTKKAERFFKERNSNGMPKNIRPIMDSALVAMAMMQGLTSAIVNPNDLRLMETIKSCDVFKGNTLYADSYLEL